jgi:tetratricopeptide (TPR) repeat protein
MNLPAAILCAALLSAADNPMQQALAHMEAGRHQQAIAILKDLLGKNPGNYGVIFNLAVAQSMAGAEAEAAVGFRKALEIEPNLYEAQLNLGQLLLKGKEYAEAAALLERAVAQRPKEFMPVFLLAGALLATGKPAEAEARFRAAAELDPKQVDARLGLGRSLAAQGKWGGAASAFREAAALAPADESLQFELAEVYEKAKMPAEAAAVYARFPDNLAAQERLALHRLNAGDAPGAIEALLRVVAKSPTPAVKYALATAYLRAGLPEKSIPLAAELVQAAPDNLAMRLFHGRLLRDQKRYADAAREFSAAAQSSPDSLEAWNELAGMLILLQHYEPALKAIEKARALGGETPAYHYFRATMLDALKQPRPAVESYERFLELSNGQSPEEEFKARQRVRVLRRSLER